MFINFFADMDAELASCAVTRFAEANFSRINNKSGFLMGILRRVKEDGPDRGDADLKILPRSVRYRLQDIIDDVCISPLTTIFCARLCCKPLMPAQGRLSMDDVDARMCKALADLPSDLGLEAVDKFANAHLDTVRSKTGFMVSSPSPDMYSFPLTLPYCVLLDN